MFADKYTVDTFEIADVKPVLRVQAARVMRFYFAASFVIVFILFERSDLCSTEKIPSLAALACGAFSCFLKLSRSSGS